jgi:hypothetical protein
VTTDQRSVPGRRGVAGAAAPRAVGVGKL